MMETVAGLKTNHSSILSPRVEDAPRKSLIDHARVLKENKEYSLAMALLRQASFKESRNPEILKLMAEILDTTGKRDESLIVKKVLKSLKSNFQSFFNYAQELYLGGQEDEEALKAYFECLSVMEDTHPELFEVYKNMGNISVKLKDLDGAEEFYNKAYRLNPESDVLMVNRGTLEVQRGDFEKALFFFREAIKKNPHNDKAWVGLALMHAEYGDHALAWGNVTYALDLNPMNRTAILMVANWALRDGKEFYAINVIENYLVQENFDEELSLFLIHLYCCMNQFQKARMEINKILAWNPSLKAVRDVEKQLSRMKE